MSRRAVIIILIVAALVAGAIGGYSLLPKKYKVSEHMTQAVVFWNDTEAFLFLAVNTTGQTSNALQEKLTGASYGFVVLLLDPPRAFNKQDISAYHLFSSGQLDRFSLPEQSSMYGTWALRDGKLQLIPTSGGYESRNGFRWDGGKFIPVLPEKSQPSATPGSTLSPDDLDEEEDDGFINKAERQKFKDAGWHYKVLPAYQGRETEATLPMDLGAAAFKLTVRSFLLPTKLQQFDTTTIGMRSLELSGEARPAEVLWSQNGWKNISSAEYQSMFQKFGRAAVQPVRMLTLLFILLLFLLLKFGALGKLLFALGGVKKKVLQNMATAYSFPPATPEQFLRLDLAALERYTREFEFMGLTRLLDFSLTADRGNHPPTFCRLLVSARYHCFAEISQFFPRGKDPMELKCSVLSILQDGWTIAFADRKPLAAGSLVRRKRAIGAAMPEANVRDLFQAFLKMRDQVCMDLGISPLTDDTLEAYIKQVQRALGEIREAVQQKSFAVGVPQVYLRKFSMVKTKPEYVWLGDYPKEAEQRKQGFTVPAGAH